MADCTGHGIPGAMVSLICSAALSKSLYEDFIVDPSRILDNCRNLVEERFVKSKDKIKDGMDITLGVIDDESKMLRWSGANSPLWIIRDGSDEIEIIKPDKQPVGYVEKPAIYST